MYHVTFITGNQNKADYLSNYLGYPVDHIKLDLDEIQSIDLHEIVKHKLVQAYESVKKPIIVEDVGLEFAALGGLPGPFIKFFVEQTGFDTICRMLDGMSRKATVRCVFGYFDGSDMEYFEGSLDGEIAQSSSGENGFGFDKIFIPEGYTVTRASLSQEDDKKTYLKMKPFAKVKEYLESR